MGSKRRVSDAMDRRRSATDNHLLIKAEPYAAHHEDDVVVDNDDPLVQPKEPQ